MENLTSLDERLVTVLVSVSLSMLVSMFIFRLNLHLINGNSVKEARHRVLFFCRYLVVLVTNNSVDDANEFIKIFIKEYGVMRGRDIALTNDYESLIGILFFLKSNGYIADPSRKSRDIDLIEQILSRYEKKQGHVRLCKKLKVGDRN